MNILKPFTIQRRTKQENRFHPKMGALSIKVTRIQKIFLGIPVQTLHKYRETYFGEVKDCSKCEISIV